MSNRRNFRIQCVPGALHSVSLRDSPPFPTRVDPENHHKSDFEFQYAQGSKDTMDLSKGLRIIPKLIAKVFADQAVRNDILQRANELATSVLTAAGLAAARLNSAFFLSRKKARIQAISKLTNGEIESFSRMNGHCALIYQSSNALSRWTSAEAVNVNMAGKAGALAVFKKLEDAERGMQLFFNNLPGCAVQSRANVG